VPEEFHERIHADVGVGEFGGVGVAQCTSAPCVRAACGPARLNARRTRGELRLADKRHRVGRNPLSGKTRMCTTHPRSTSTFGLTLPHGSRHRLQTPHEVHSLLYRLPRDRQLRRHFRRSVRRLQRSPLPVGLHSVSGWLMGGMLREEIVEPSGPAAHRFVSRLGEAGFRVVARSAARFVIASA
jgi:hypothetical protein